MDTPAVPEKIPSNRKSLFILPGIIISLLLANAVLGSRLQQGQAKDLVNLVGSQAVISCWCFSVWMAGVCILQFSNIRHRLLQLALVLLYAIISSNAFYYLSVFEDYPLSPIRELDWRTGVLRLSYRGTLVGGIMYPMLYYIVSSGNIQREKRRIARQRQAMLVERAQQLEEMVAARTRDLEKAVRQLEQSELELAQNIQAKDKVITMVLHDLRSPLSSLRIISSSLTASYRHMSQDAIGEQLHHLNNNIAAINEFTSQFFAWAVSQQAHFRVVPEQVSLQKLFSEITELYTDIARINNNRMQVSDTGLHCRTDYYILSTVVRNLVDNANKHMRNGCISLAAGMKDGCAHITVSDTGKGLTQEQVAHFINPGKAGLNGGNGSNLVYSMLQKINGRLEIDTAQAGGTTFHVLLPDA